MTAPAPAAPPPQPPPQPPPPLFAVGAAALTDLIEADDQSIVSEIARAQNAVFSMLRDFTEWFDTQLVRQFTDSVSSIVQASSQSIALETDAFLTSSVRQMTGKSFQPAGAVKQQILGPRERARGLRKPPESYLNGDRRGVTRSGVYGRVADTLRFQTAKIDKALLEAVKSGKLPPDLEDPLSVAANRARQAVAMDLRHVRRAQVRRTLMKAHREGLIDGYRRVIHPELSRGGVCGMCIAASTREYHVENLMPIHHECECTVLPVAGKNDPGLDLNMKSYQQALKLSDGKTDIQSLTKTRFRVDEHGELGPVLAPADEPIRTRRQVQGATNPITKPKTDQEKLATLVNKRDTMMTEFDKLQTKIRNGELNAEDWQMTTDRMSDRIDELSQQIDGLRRGPTPLTELIKPPTLRNAARQVIPPTVNDLPHIDGDHDVRSDVIAANPDYEPGNEFAINCVHAVQAEEMRRRGFDVVATPLPREMWAQNGRSAQEALTKSWRPPRMFTDTNAVGVQNIASRWPVGARGWVVVNWKTGGSHIFTVENTKDGPVWLDPQRGAVINLDDYTGRAQNLLKIIRVDDLEPANSVTEFVRRPRAEEILLTRRRVSDRTYAGHASQLREAS